MYWLQECIYYCENLNLNKKIIGIILATVCVLGVIGLICYSTSNTDEENFSDDLKKLHMASMTGNIGMIRDLLDNGSEIEDKDNDGMTPLHYAVFHSNDRTNVVSELLKKGSDVNAKDHFGKTPLHIASSLGFGNITRCLLEFGAKVNEKAKNGDTALHFACHYGKNRIMELLINAYADVNARDNDDETPLHSMAKTGFNSVPFLLRKGAKINAVEKNGWTPLFIATYYRHEDIVKSLVDHGADVNIKDKDGLTALELANKFNFTDIANLLQKAIDNPVDAFLITNNTF